MSFQEHVVIGPDPSVAQRPPTVMASAFHASRQAPLSQNPAYAPESMTILHFTDRNALLQRASMYELGYQPTGRKSQTGNGGYKWNYGIAVAQEPKELRPQLV